MKAFYFANHTTTVLTSSDGRRLVGTINDLEPGNYLVFGKADIGTNVASGYPPPAWPYGAGALTLSFGGATDISYVGVVPDDGQNNENVELMVAAKSNDRSSARLYFQAVYPLRMAVNSVRLAALQLEELLIAEEGESPPDATEEANNTRASLIQRAMTDVASARLFTSGVLHSHDDDGG
jgi:hypothetical protein